MDYSYSAPVYTEPAPAPKAPQPGKTKAIISLVLGIVGILMCCCYGFGCIPGIVGLILAILAKKDNGGKFSGLAVAGLVLSIIASVFGVGYLGMILVGFLGNGAYSQAFQESFWNTYNSMMDGMQ